MRDSKANGGKGGRKLRESRRAPPTSRRSAEAVGGRCWRSKEFFREIGLRGAKAGKETISPEKRSESGRKGAAKIHAERRQGKALLAALEPFRAWLELHRDLLQQMQTQDAGAADYSCISMRGAIPKSITYGDLARLLSAMNGDGPAPGPEIQAQAERIVASALDDLREPMPVLRPADGDDMLLTNNHEAMEERS